MNTSDRRQTLALARGTRVAVRTSEDVSVEGQQDGQGLQTARIARGHFELIARPGPLKLRLKTDEGGEAERTVNIPPGGDRPFEIDLSDVTLPKPTPSQDSRVEVNEPSNATATEVTVAPELMPEK